MKNCVIALLIVTFVSSTVLAQNKIEISLENKTQGEMQTRDQLQRLLQTYDLSKWIFTKSISINEKATPHSHPVLTLHTRHLKDDDLLVSTFVHGQLHWFLTINDKQTAEAIKDVRVLFPKVPTGFPAGSEDEDGTYLHLLVNYLEYRADREIFGELRARQIMDFWAHDHYTWIYQMVLERPRDIGNIMFKHKLIPPSRTQ